MDTPKHKYTDPLGRPLEQGSPSFTDQQAGGDLTGRETDPRDDNFSSDASGQLTRDMSSGPDTLPGRSSDVLREQPVLPPQVPVKGRTTPVIAPDGNEDPGSSIDDHLAPPPPAKAVPRP